MKISISNLILKSRIKLILNIQISLCDKVGLPTAGKDGSVTLRNRHHTKDGQPESSPNRCRKSGNFIWQVLTQDWEKKKKELKSKLGREGNVLP